MKKNVVFFLIVMLLLFTVTTAQADTHPGNSETIWCNSSFYDTKYFVKKVTWTANYDDSVFDVSITDWNWMDLVFGNDQLENIIQTKDSYTLVTKCLIKDASVQAPSFHFIVKENAQPGDYVVSVVVTGPNGQIEEYKGRITVGKHDFSILVDTVSSTCSSEGFMEYACSCGVTKKEVIPKQDHTEQIIAGKAASCTETGLTDGKKCSVCGEILVEQEVIPVTEHIIETTPGKEATCTEPGLTEKQVCSVCGEILVEQEVIPPTGHTVETIPGKEATCTEPGLTEKQVCSICGEILVDQEVIPATGHTAVIDPEIKPTYTTEGLTEGSHCAVCGEILVKQEPIEKLRFVGDCNGDGIVDGRDLLRLAKFMAGQDVKIDEKAADLTGDGEVDGRDVLRLAKQLAES